MEEENKVAKVWEIIAKMRNEMVAMSFPNDDHSRSIRLLENWLRSEEPFPPERWSDVSHLTATVVMLGEHSNRFRKLINELSDALREILP